MHTGNCTGQAGSRQMSLNTEFLPCASHCGSVTGGRESVRRLRSVRLPRPAHFFCTVREVDAQVSSKFTIDPYRRESASVSRLRHVHPEQGVDLECVLFRTGCSSPRVVQCFLPGSRPLRAALLRAAFLVPGLETDWVVAMWHPPFHRCCMAILCKVGVPGRELSVELTSQSQPFLSCSAHWPDKLPGRAFMQVASEIPHRWASLAGIDGGGVSERDIQHKKSRNAHFAIAAQWEICSFVQPNSFCSRVERVSCSYLIRRDCCKRPRESYLTIII